GPGQSPPERGAVKAAPLFFSGRFLGFHLWEALLDFYVDTERTVVVAQGYDRDVAVHVVLDLNDLLLRRADVGDVGDCDVASDLLLHGDTRGGVLPCARRADTDQRRI